MCGADSLWSLPGPPLPRYGHHQQSLAWGHLPPISSPIFTRPSPVYLCAEFPFLTIIRHRSMHFLKNLLITPQGMQDLSSRPGITPTPPAVEVWSLNHCTTKEVSSHWIQSPPEIQDALILRVSTRSHLPRFCFQRRAHFQGPGVRT